MSSGRDWVSLSHRDQEVTARLPLVVSYHTSPFYERDAFELARSCQQWGLDYHIQGLQDQGGWRGNTNHKPTFLLEMSQRYPSRPLLWLDADARVRRSPDLLEGLSAPIGYHVLRGREPLSGTVFLGEGRDPLLQAWIAAVVRSPDHTDQVCMARAVRSLGITPFLLPSEYCWIFDISSETMRPDLSARPVIEHMQASRWTRKGL